jgi:RimJ/RimL family protein N-acetyltransferase
LAAAWKDPAVAEFTSVPTDRSLAHAQRWIDGAEKRERNLLSVDRVIEVDGVLAGEVGLSSFDRDRGAALLGYWVAPDFRRQGLASWAVSEFCDWATLEFDLQAVLVEVAAANPGSRRVVERTGFEVIREGAEAVLVLRVES